MSKETYFYQALAQVVGATPPAQFKEMTALDYHSCSDKESTALQDWASDETTLSWATGIGNIEAALLIVDEAINNANIEGDL